MLNLRGHPGLNWGPFDLQSKALPLSYNASAKFIKKQIKNSKKKLKTSNNWIWDSAYCTSVRVTQCPFGKSLVDVIVNSI